METGDGGGASRDHRAFRVAGNPVCTSRRQEPDCRSAARCRAEDRNVSGEGAMVSVLSLERFLDFTNRAFFADGIIAPNRSSRFSSSVVGKIDELARRRFTRL